MTLPTIPLQSSPAKTQITLWGRCGRKFWRWHRKEPNPEREGRCSNFNDVLLGGPKSFDVTTHRVNKGQLRSSLTSCLKFTERDSTTSLHLALFVPLAPGPKRWNPPADDWGQRARGREGGRAGCGVGWWGTVDVEITHCPPVSKRKGSRRSTDPTRTTVPSP